MYIPERGDIIWITLDPAAGNEIKKRRTALVLSTGQFNKITRSVVVAPTTNTVRENAFEVQLDHRTKTTGVVLPQQFKTLDYRVRKAEFIEKAPGDITRKTLAKAMAILSYD